ECWWAGLDGGGDSFGELGGVGQQDGRGELIMLGAGEEVGGDEGGIGVGVGDYKSLRGAEDAVDADFAEELLLGERYKDVPGTADLVDSRDGLGAVGHRSDSLYTAGAEDVIYAGDVGCHEFKRGDRPVAADGCGHDDFRHARDTSGDDGHEDGGGVD